VHNSQVVGWTEVDYPLFEAHPVIPTDAEKTIAGYVAERIPDGATIQAGIGGMPNALLAMLNGHRDLGVHTELLSDGVIDLVEAGVITGTQKVFRRGKIVTTLALGSKRLYDFCTKIPASTSLRWTGSTILEIIARQQNFVAINATTEVDFYGQCASETVAGQYYWVEGRPDGTRSMFLKLLGSQWPPAVPELHQRLSSAPPARIADIGVGSGWSSIAMARATRMCWSTATTSTSSRSGTRSSMPATPDWMTG
jgi:hypothetical protein